MSIDITRLDKHMADQLRAWRCKRSLTQDELAKRVGVARTTIANIETGRQHPPLHLLYALCSVLDIEPQEILPTLRQVTMAQPIEYEIDGESHSVTPKVLQFLASIDRRKKEAS